VSVIEPLLRAENIKMAYGPVVALQGASITVRAGQVTCLLGDNGAGKSTLIKILSGAVRPDAGSLSMEGASVTFASPREAIDAGIATVYQDLALVPILPIYRNFVLGNEPLKGIWPFRRFDVRSAKETARSELHQIGIEVTDASRLLGTLSGGQRQCVAIARAVHFGARVLILDEPTSALGIRQSQFVLRYISETSRRGVGVIFITHNPVHAHRVGDEFAILDRGKTTDVWKREEISVDELVLAMSGSRTEELDFDSAS
jgi:simple sugar transport system ATP-binding protein